MTPAVKVYVLTLIAQFESRIAALEKRVQQLSAKSPKRPNYLRCRRELSSTPLP